MTGNHANYPYYIDFIEENHIVFLPRGELTEKGRGCVISIGEEGKRAKSRWRYVKIFNFVKERLLTDLQNTYKHRRRDEGQLP
jgi:hypothetical protein